MASTHPIYLEVGSKRVFAGSIEWPGWTRSGRDEVAAIEALLTYGPRFARVVRGTRLGFEAPSATSALEIVESLTGDATTDFGAPDAPPSADASPVGEDELDRYDRVLRACWRAFDRAVGAADGVELTKGPRGGGRNLEKIVDHVLGADEGYVAMLGRRVSFGDARRDDRADTIRAEVRDALRVAVRDGVPPGPRGGKRWTPRYFVRRSAWHVLDHAWELEDRTPIR